MEEVDKDWKMTRMVGGGDAACCQIILTTCSDFGSVR